MSLPMRKWREEDECWAKPVQSVGRVGEYWFIHRRAIEKDFELPFSTVLEKSLVGRPSVAIDAEVLGGTPHIAGTRIPVFMVLDAIEFFGSVQGALKSYPQLSIEQVKDAINFAAAVLEHPVDYEVTSPSR